MKKVSQILKFYRLYGLNLPIVCIFKRYQTKVIIISYVIIIIRICCWISLSIFFLDNFQKATLFTFLKASYTIISRPFAKEAYRVENRYQKVLEKKTSSYKKGHMVVADEENINNKYEIEFIGWLTHGVKNQSEFLHHTDLEGDTIRDQRIVKEKKQTYIDRTKLTKKTNLKNILTKMKLKKIYDCPLY